MLDSLLNLMYQMINLSKTRPPSVNKSGTHLLWRHPTKIKSCENIIENEWHPRKFKFDLRQLLLDLLFLSCYIFGAPLLSFFLSVCLSLSELSTSPTRPSSRTNTRTDRKLTDIRKRREEKKRGKERKKLWKKCLSFFPFRTQEWPRPRCWSWAKSLA